LGTWCSAFAKAGGSWPKACGELPIAVRTRACRESGAGSAERIARRRRAPTWDTIWPPSSGPAQPSHQVRTAPRTRERGGPLEALDGRVRWWLYRPDGLIDVLAVMRMWEECLEGMDEVEPAVVHGDLIPGNLLWPPL
jgi:hypothetical protein